MDHRARPSPTRGRQFDHVALPECTALLDSGIQVAGLIEENLGKHELAAIVASVIENGFRPGTLVSSTYRSRRPKAKDSSASVIYVAAVTRAAVDGCAIE